MTGKFDPSSVANRPEPIEFMLDSPADRAVTTADIAQQLSTKNESQILDYLDDLKKKVLEQPKFVNNYAIALLETLNLEDPNLSLELVERINSFVKRIKDSYFIPQFLDHIKSFALTDDEVLSHKALVALTNSFYVVEEHLRPDIIATMRLAFRNAKGEQKEKVSDHLINILKDKHTTQIEFSDETQDQLFGFALDTLGDNDHFVKRKTASVLGNLALDCPNHLDTILVLSQNIMNDKSELGRVVQDHFAKSIAGLSIAINRLRPDYDAHSTEIRVEALSHIISNLVNHETDFARKKAVFKLDTVYENVPELRNEIEKTLRRLERDPSEYVRRAVSETQTNIANFNAGIIPERSMGIKPLGRNDR
ncbi:MAG: hypothetical protein U0R17_06885 [Acidimicrobiia bacterium]